jgi:hypothetical protein
MHHLTQGIHILAQIKLHDRIEHRASSLETDLLNTCSFYTQMPSPVNHKPAQALGIAPPKQAHYLDFSDFVP